MEGNKTTEVSIVVLCYKASTLIRSFLDEIIIEGDKRSLKYEIVLVVNYWANQHDSFPAAAYFRLDFTHNTAATCASEWALFKGCKDRCSQYCSCFLAVSRSPEHQR